MNKQKMRGIARRAKVSLEAPKGLKSLVSCPEGAKASLRSNSNGSANGSVSPYGTPTHRSSHSRTAGQQHTHTQDHRCCTTVQCRHHHACCCLLVCSQIFTQNVSS